MNGFSAFLSATQAFNPAFATGTGALPQAPSKAETEHEMRLQLTGIQLRVATFMVLLSQMYRPLARARYCQTSALSRMQDLDREFD